MALSPSTLRVCVCVQCGLLLHDNPTMGNLDNSVNGVWALWDCLQWQWGLLEISNFPCPRKACSSYGWDRQCGRVRVPYSTLSGAILNFHAPQGSCPFSATRQQTPCYSRLQLFFGMASFGRGGQEQVTLTVLLFCAPHIMKVFRVTVDSPTASPNQSIKQARWEMMKGAVHTRMPDSKN